MNNTFLFGYCDLSWILSRNAYAIASRNEDYTPGDIVKMTIQTLNKFSRDLDLRVDKILFFRDTWDPEYKGYYRTHLIRQAKGEVEYKGDRRYMTEELLEDIKSDPSSTEEDIKKAEKEFKFNTIKNKAKWILVNELGKFGISTISVPGWEFDDLATLASFLVDREKPSVIITKDSDLLYSTSPRCYVWQPPLSSKPQKLVTYNDAYFELLPERFRNRLSLYQYFAMQQSTGLCGHNNMNRTVKSGTNVDDAIEQALCGDFHNFEDVDLFKVQYKTFDIWSFPKFEEAKKEITENLHRVGKLGTVPEFHNFCEKHNITGISDRYFSDFVGRFDPKLFSTGV